MANEDSYARPELLAEPAWLREHSQDANLRIVDCAVIEAYRRAHIPGAVALGFNPFIKDPSNGVYVLPSEQFGELMGKLGVGGGTLVVAYDDNNSLHAARLWWVLRYYGHENVKVLNGGWHRWLHEGLPITTHATNPQPATFTPSTIDELTCGVDDLKGLVGDTGTSILDVRSAEEFAGTNNRGNARAGHVPGAAHIEWTDFVTRDERRVFKPAAEIKSMLDHAGVTPDKPTVTYCQGGIRAAHGMFVLTLMGHDRVRNYDGSMREWANRDDTPLELPAATT